MTDPERLDETTEQLDVPEERAGERLELGAPRSHRRAARARRPLSWRVEARRQLRRRRTLFSLLLVLALPLIIVAAFAIGNGEQGSGPNFIDLAQQGAANFVIFVLFVTAGLLLVILTALFCGDSVPSEASWSTLRYLLTGPVPRARLLTSKIIIGLVTSAAALVVLVGWSIVVGGVAYGWGDFTSLAGVQMAGSLFWPRLALAAAYIMITLLQVGAISLWISVQTDAPLAAVGGTVMVVIVSSILDQISALGSIRHGLPMHFADAWTNLLSDQVQTLDLQRGVAWSLLYTVVFGLLAYIQFLRKDVLS